MSEGRELPGEGAQYWIELTFKSARVASETFIGIKWVEIEEEVNIMAPLRWAGISFIWISWWATCPSHRLQFFIISSSIKVTGALFLSCSRVSWDNLWDTTRQLDRTGFSIWIINLIEHSVRYIQSRPIRSKLFKLFHHWFSNVYLINLF